ncbi:MAG: RagB/SusD family nutrient uptake outer membrane protein [Cytophagales bacterium]|nr:RagB/SusD family nutrient uptake outer membrane protein [Cytophagales bacterium]
MKKYLTKIFCILSILALQACNEPLEEEIFSELTPDTFLNTESGMTALLNSVYANAQLHSFVGHIAYHYLPAMTSGEAWNRGGSIEVWLTALSDFAWDSNHQYVLGIWIDAYEAIRDANIVLDNISNENFSTDFQTLTMAEARFLRAWSYTLLYDLFGPVPLYTSSSTDSLLLSRATEDQMKSFIEQELNAVAQDLPVNPSEFGKSSRGAALGVLCKYYLNTRQWQACIDVSKQIMDLGVYSLVADYTEVFSLENEGNTEMLWVLPRTAPEAPQSVNALTFPTDFPLPLPNQNVFAARTYLFDAFVNSFESTDTRKDLIVTEYINTSGELITLLGNDQSLSLKYEFDPDAAGSGMGNDIPVIRYADILLARAEALNELNGPTQEALDLINQVRGRAQASLLSLGGFTKESLRAHIGKEREWEFYMEGKRRQDQIRQNTFVSGAIARSKNAGPHHVRFAIPQIDIDANPAIEQNDGY